MLTFVVTGPIVERSGPQAALLAANGLSRCRLCAVLSC